MLRLEQNRKTTILTRFGKTKEIDIVDGIGQEKVLSGPEFSALVDEIEVELKVAGFGLNYGYLTIASLLFMDDITLISKTYKDIREIIQFVRIICNKWHLVINYQKTKALIFNSKECKQEATDIGGKSIEIVRRVKYLGEVLTSDLRLKDHIEERRITTQTVLNTCLYTASNEVLSEIRMITIIKLYKSTIIPALLYVCETWIPTENDNQNLLNIQLSIIRKIVKAPKSTPKISLYGEIGELPIDFIIDKKQIMYLRILLTSKTQINDITKIQLENPNKNNVVTYIYSLLTKYNNLSVEQIVLYTKNRWNKFITNKINEQANLLYLNEGNKLRKLHHLNKF